MTGCQKKMPKSVTSVEEKILFLLCSLPLYALQYFSMGWPFGHEACFAFAAFKHVFSFGDWISLAVIAVIRCLALTKPGSTSLFSVILSHHL
jgi:hypothetical protein